MLKKTMSKKHFYVSIIFSEEGSKSAELGKHLDDLAEDYQRVSQGDPMMGLPNYTKLEREYYAYVFAEDKKATDFSRKLLNLEGVEGLRLGSFK
jgi:hypothetical protein